MVIVTKNQACVDSLPKGGERSKLSIQRIELVYQIFTHLSS